MSSAIFDKLSTLKTAPTNPMEKLFLKLDADTRNLLEDLLADPKISTLSIHSTLRAEGISIARYTLTEYRKAKYGIARAS